MRAERGLLTKEGTSPSLSGADAQMSVTAHAVLRTVLVGNCAALAFWELS